MPDIWNEFFTKTKKKVVEKEAEKLVAKNKEQIVYILGGVFIASVAGAYLLGCGAGERKAYRSLVRCATKIAEAKLA